MTIEFSVALPCYSAEDPGNWDFVLDRARLMDEVGVDRLAVSDHVVFGERLEEYGRPELGGQAGGTQPTGPDGSWLEPLTLLSVVAGSTSRIRLQTNILLAALRRPVVLAKAAATLDVLSHGRLDVGVGVGWQREEYEAAGLDFATRGALLDETLAVCRTLWTQQRAAYSSPNLSFEAIHMMPKPVQAGGVPIWVSGTVNTRVVRRLATFGAGWIPWSDAAANLVPAIATMKQALADAGRDPAELGVVGGLRALRKDDGSLDVAASVEALGPQIEAGVTDVRCRFALPEDPSAAADLLRELVPAFRAAVGRTEKEEEF
ncbi:MAG TPA: TIGR03619 family F420-dependent LLM class oxidoreductase [Jatrophihabitans sp.]|jgi:probable F420-dependent oxidoreductase